MRRAAMSAALALAIVTAWRLIGSCAAISVWSASCESNRDEKVAAGQRPHLVLQDSAAAHGRLGVEAQGVEAVCEEPGQRGRQIHADQTAANGAEMSTSAVPIDVRSRRERGRSAEMIPTVMPPSTHRNAAPIVSDAVAGSRSLTRLMTDSSL